MSAHKVLLITGATGKQGRATINALLASPESSKFTILALTRKGTSSSATSLAQKSPNIKIIEGNLDDSPRIFTAASKVTPHPIWGVFGVTTPQGGGEERQGKALVDAALAAGVRQFVFSSVERGGEKTATTPTNVPHFATKFNVEEHLKSRSAAAGGKMAWTLLHPVAFMDNLMPNMIGKVFATAWKQHMNPENKPLQLICSADIGVFAAAAFLKPDEYRNRSLSLAGDEITYSRANQIFKDKVGTDIPTTYDFLASAGLWAMSDVGLMFRWFRDEGFGADVQACRRIHPGLMTFAQWLDTKSAFA